MEDYYCITIVCMLHAAIISYDNIPSYFTRRPLAFERRRLKCRGNFLFIYKFNCLISYEYSLLSCINSIRLLVHGSNRLWGTTMRVAFVQLLYMVSSMASKGKPCLQTLLFEEVTSPEPIYVATFNKHAESIVLLRSKQ